MSKKVSIFEKCVKYLTRIAQAARRIVLKNLVRGDLYPEGINRP